MQQIAKEYGVPPSECAFVGDGKNDVTLAKSVGISVAFNAQIELSQIATFSIKQKKGQENLAYIKELIFSPDSF